MKKQTVKKKRNIEALAIIMLFLAMAAALILIYKENTELEDQVKNLEGEYERGVMEGVNDFTAFVISKVKLCQPVKLMAGKESATVTDVRCEAEK